MEAMIVQCKRCGRVFTKAELTSGLCAQCREEVNEESKDKLAQAESRTLARGTRAAAKLIAAMEKQGRGGQTAPQVLDSFMASVGGASKLGQMMHVEFEKAHGIGVTEAEAEAWGPVTPRLRLQWYELVHRIMDKTDQNKSLDISALDEADLESILSDIGRKMVLEDKGIRQAVISSAMEDAKFRRQVFFEIARTDKALADEFLSNGGIITLAHEEIDDTVSSPPEYNPQDDEWDEA